MSKTSRGGWARALAISAEVVTSLALGLLLVRDYNHSVAGYVAAYDFASLWILVLLFAVLGLALLIPNRTRVAGLSTLAATALLFLIFFLGVKVSWKLGFVRWANETMQRIGPDVKASLVIYFNPGTSDEEIENFIATTLRYPSVRGHGETSGDVLTMYLRLLPNQGYEGIALTFSSKVTSSERDEIVGEARRSPIVHRLFEHTAPSDIKSMD